MKNFRLFFLACISLSLVVFSSCEEEEKIVEVPVEVTKEVQRISFENVALGAEGYESNFPNGLVLADVDFYNNYDPTYLSWEGFAVSKLTDKTTAGYDNQYSVYANGGADGSEKFALAYSGFYETTNIKFLSAQEFKFKELMINNSTLVALDMKSGSSFSKQFAAGDWFKLIIKGIKANGSEAGKVEFYLADFREGKTFICEDWTKVDLTSLGEVNKLEFTFDSTDKGEYGMNTPAYACIDNIVYYVD